MNSRPFHMIKNKFKKGFHPIMYREKKGGREAVSRSFCVSWKKKARKGALLVRWFCNV